MSLNRFKPCDPEHSELFEYCCFKSNKVFCQACWYKQTHPYRCYSSQCGHFQKLAYLVIDRTLEMKVMHCSSEMSPSYEVYDNFHRSFFRIKEAITQKIKSDVESKLPLFLWTSMCEMLTAKNPKLNGLSFEQSTCSEMLKIIKKKQENKCQNLEETVKSLDKVNHLYKGLQNKIKSQQFSGVFQKEVIGIVDFWAQQANQLVFNLTTSLKKHMEMEIGKLLQTFDPSIQFDGIKFTNKRSFDSIQHYNYTSLSASLFPDSFIGQGGSLYHGIKLDIPKLEECPQILMEISKSMLKERIFQIHSNIRQMKSLYPYKYAYVMATTLKPDIDYELAMINLQKINIKSYEKKSEHTFLNSINLIIMGPQLITVQFKNYPVKKTEVMIYGAIESREKHYTDIIENQLGITKDKTQKTSARNITKIPFESKLSDTELVYVQFELAYEHLFTNIEQKYGYVRDRSSFEGERSALARGIKEFQDIVAGWNENASINFNIQRDVAELTRLFI